MLEDATNSDWPSSSHIGHYMGKTKLKPRNGPGRKLKMS